jgi:hypothetical protein
MPIAARRPRRRLLTIAAASLVPVIGWAAPATARPPARLVPG